MQIMNTPALTALLILLCSAFVPTTPCSILMGIPRSQSLQQEMLSLQPLLG